MPRIHTSLDYIVCKAEICCPEKIWDISYSTRSTSLICFSIRSSGDKEKLQLLKQRSTNNVVSAYTNCHDPEQKVLPDRIEKDMESLHSSPEQGDLMDKTKEKEIMRETASENLSTTFQLSCEHPSDSYNTDEFADF